MDAISEPSMHQTTIEEFQISADPSQALWRTLKINQHSSLAELDLPQQCMPVATPTTSPPNPDTGTTPIDTGTGGGGDAADVLISFFSIDENSRVLGEDKLIRSGTTVARSEYIE